MSKKASNYINLQNHLSKLKYKVTKTIKNLERGLHDKDNMKLEDYIFILYSNDKTLDWYNLTNKEDIEAPILDNTLSESDLHIIKEYVESQSITALTDAVNVLWYEYRQKQLTFKELNNE